MSVNPGFSGQVFIPHSVEKVAAARGAPGPPAQPRGDRSRRRRGHDERGRAGRGRGLDSRRGRRRLWRRRSGERPARSADRPEWPSDPAMPSSVTTLRVRYAETDQMGIVMPTRTISSGSRWRARAPPDARLELSRAGGERRAAARHRSELRVPPSARYDDEIENPHRRAAVLAGAHGILLRGDGESASRAGRHWKDRPRRTDRGGRPCRVPDRIREVFA